jgi:Protein of unknown function (DUF742)
MSHLPNDPGPDRPEDPRRRIRPYSMTAGRTLPTRSDLELEALVSTTRQGRLEAAWLALERRSIVDYCQETQSIAEVSARLGIPVNVTRILVDDLSEAGLVVVYQPPAGGARPSVELLERVLHGLRGL